GDPAQIKLMGYAQIVRGHVDSIARAINVANAQPNNQGLATVNPIFTWVRLAQRIPVRVHIDEVPPGIVLAAGMTATVEIDDRSSAATGTRPGSIARAMGTVNHAPRVLGRTDLMNGRLTEEDHHAWHILVDRHGDRGRRGVPVRNCAPERSRWSTAQSKPC